MVGWLPSSITGTFTSNSPCDDGTCMYGKCTKISKTGTHKILVRIANRGDPDQTASSEAV